MGMGLEEALKCVHCGFCLEACPTYVVTKSEVHSPRGRITAFKLGINSEGFQTCMFCRRCELACPSGVKYSEIIKTVRRPNPLEKIAIKLLDKPASLVPFLRALRINALVPLEYKEENEDLILFPGCLTSVVFRSSVEKVLNYLKSLGYKVSIYNDTCCGLAHEHVGEVLEGKERVKRLKEVFKGKIVVSLSSNCTAHMRENGIDNVYDLAEFIIKFNLPLPKRDGEVTVHEPCHAHLLGIDKYIRPVIEKMGLKIVESEEPSFECGAGGDFFIFNKELAEKVMGVKKEKTLKSGVKTVISTNPSCSLAFLKMGLRPLHIADLL